ncbi:hypothetical protein BJ165DRAFT_1590619 [Panaeolus papilionaceus]|nr:hypothetical protein BJ165DRAFT_1590619 [Panaeolus papilionaceus]
MPATRTRRQYAYLHEPLVGPDVTLEDLFTLWNRHSPGQEIGPALLPDPFQGLGMLATELPLNPPNNPSFMIQDLSNPIQLIFPFIAQEDHRFGHDMSSQQRHSPDAPVPRDTVDQPQQYPPPPPSHPYARHNDTNTPLAVAYPAADITIQTARNNNRDGTPNPMVLPQTAVPSRPQGILAGPRARDQEEEGTGTLGTDVPQGFLGFGLSPKQLYELIGNERWGMMVEGREEDYQVVTNTDSFQNSLPRVYAPARRV